MMAERAQWFFINFPHLKEVLTALTEHGIPFFIGGSGSLFLFGNEREPKDVDIFIPNKHHDEVDALFGIASEVYTSPLERVRNSHPFGLHELQITSHLEITVEAKVYAFSFDQSFVRKDCQMEMDGLVISVLPPEDALIIKAILQRGVSVGKHDVEDITSFLQIHKNLDKEYLQKRIKFLGAENRIDDIFLL
jgi:predicted nucleotidyltransferase